MPSANTLVREVDENAFASIVQARPCPLFGRPVRPWGRPLDYGPVLLRKPTGFGLTADTRSSGCRFTRQNPNVGPSPGCVRRFQLRARVGFTLFVLPGRRGITPAFGYGAPHPDARGTSTLLTHALPSAHYGRSDSWLAASSAQRHEHRPHTSQVSLIHVPDLLIVPSPTT